MYTQLLTIFVPSPRFISRITASPVNLLSGLSVLIVLVQILLLQPGEISCHPIIIRRQENSSLGFIVSSSKSAISSMKTETTSPSGHDLRNFLLSHVQSSSIDNVPLLRIKRRGGGRGGGGRAGGGKAGGRPGGMSHSHMARLGSSRTIGKGSRINAQQSTITLVIVFSVFISFFPLLHWRVK